MSPAELNHLEVIRGETAGGGASRQPGQRSCSPDPPAAQCASRCRAQPGPSGGRSSRSEAGDDSLEPRCFLGDRSTPTSLASLRDTRDGAADLDRQAGASGGAGGFPGPRGSDVGLLRNRQAAPGGGSVGEASVLVPVLCGDGREGGVGGGGRGGGGWGDRARGGGVERDAGTDPGGAAG